MRNHRDTSTWTAEEWAIAGHARQQAMRNGLFHVMEETGILAVFAHRLALEVGVVET